MKSKILINPQKRRKIPKHFSWVDHRLVRENYLKKCGTDALALYLFLVTVGDHEGLSYYRDESIEKYLNFSSTMNVKSCRKELINAGLISFLSGMYQVLDLAATDNSPTAFNEILKRGNKMYAGCSSKNNTNGKAESIGSIIEKMFGGK